MPAAEHSLIAFPDPWVSYLCHRCLRHYITLLYGGLKSRKRGPRFPLVSRQSIHWPVSRQRPLVCQIVNVQSKQLSGHFTLPPPTFFFFFLFLFANTKWGLVVRVTLVVSRKKYSLALFRFDLSPVPNVQNNAWWRERKGFEVFRCLSRFD